MPQFELSPSQAQDVVNAMQQGRFEDARDALQRAINRDDFATKVGAEEWEQVEWDLGSSARIDEIELEPL